MVVGAVTAPTSTLFWPGGIWRPPFWHWYTAEPLTVRLMTRSPPPSPDSDAEHVVEIELVPVPLTWHTGEPPFLKCGLDAAAVPALTSVNSATARINIRFSTVPPILGYWTPRRALRRSLPLRVGRRTFCAW